MTARSWPTTRLHVPPRSSSTSEQNSGDPDLLDELHTLVGAGAVDRDDVGVVQRGDRLGLAAKPSGRLAPKPGAENLQCDAATRTASRELQGVLPVAGAQ
ncbi:MAG: hypothetical protein CL908_06255 [Deltaproteobacteria bacterium]|nr:hypothetical protein [Deltaproteobacteria bacterium]